MISLKDSCRTLSHFDKPYHYENVLTTIHRQPKFSFRLFIFALPYLPCSNSHYTPIDCDASLFIFFPLIFLNFYFVEFAHWHYVWSHPAKLVIVKLLRTVCRTQHEPVNKETKLTNWKRHRKSRITYDKETVWKSSNKQTYSSTKNRHLLTTGVDESNKFNIKVREKKQTRLG